MRVNEMAKKSGGRKGSRSAKADQSAAERRAELKAYYDKIAKVIPRMHYNARTGTLTVGSYRSVDPDMKVTKKR